MTENAADGSQPDELLRVWEEPGGAARSVIVHAAGEIDLVSASQLDEALDEVLARPAAPGHVVVDLTGVTFLGSVGLSLLVKNDQRLRDAGGGLHVVTGNRLVARAIAMTGLAEKLTLHDTLAEAVTVAS
jgi:anti-sigma B factor antagonist